MSESNGAADAAAVAVTPAQSTGSAPAVDTATATDGTSEPFINKREFVDMARLVRSLKEEVASLKGTARTPVPETKATTDTDRLSALEFRAVIAEQAPHLTGEQRARLSKLYALEKPSDPDTWVRGELTAVGWDRPATTPATPAPVPPAQAKQATNAGTPGIGGPGIDPQTLGRDGWKALSGDDLRKAFDAVVSRDPSIGNKFAPRTKP